ncbi:hypothetical protein J2T21_004223, partial [Paeniglutamicibacter psychrophenolicus]|nr:hypothetical protein [Paeniglutamicibacter psychrophenolicus]
MSGSIHESLTAIAPSRLFPRKGYPFRCPNCTHRSTLVSVARHGRSTGPRSK